MSRARNLLSLGINQTILAEPDKIDSVCTSSQALQARFSIIFGDDWQEEESD